MENVKTIGIKGTFAVKKLRERKLKSGLPFMINAKELPSNECYLEYPDGTIKLIFVMHSKTETKVIRELSHIECKVLRSRFNFS